MFSPISSPGDLKGLIPSDRTLQIEFVKSGIAMDDPILTIKLDAPVLPVYEIEKSVQEQKPKIKHIIDLNIRTLSKSHWQVDVEPRDVNGRWTKGMNRIKKESIQKDIDSERRVRIGVGAIINIKKDKSDKVGDIAKVVQVIGQNRYVIKFGVHGDGEKKVVEKEQIIKKHHQEGGWCRDILAVVENKDSEAHKVPDSTPEGYRTSEQEKLISDHKDGILGRAKKIYYHYKNDLDVNLEQLGISLEDLTQTAQVAALRHVHKFNPKRGNFEPFIYTAIDSDLKRYISEKTSTWGLISIPRKERLLLWNIKKEIARIQKEENRTPGFAEMKLWAMQKMKVTEKEAVRILSLPEKIYSLEGMPGEHEWVMDMEAEESVPLIAKVKDPNVSTENEIAMKDNHQKIVQVIDSELDPILAKIVKMTFGITDTEITDETMTSEEIASELNKQGVKIEDRTVREKISEAVEKLRTNKRFRKRFKSLLEERVAIKSEKQPFQHYIQI